MCSLVFMGGCVKVHSTGLFMCSAKRTSCLAQVSVSVIILVCCIVVGGSVCISAAHGRKSDPSENSCNFLTKRLQWGRVSSAGRGKDSCSLSTARFHPTAQLFSWWPANFQDFHISWLVASLSLMWVSESDLDSLTLPVPHTCCLYSKSPAPASWPLQVRYQRYQSVNSEKLRTCVAFQLIMDEMLG